MATVVTCRLNEEGICGQSPSVHVADGSTQNCALAARSTTPWAESGQIRGPCGSRAVSSHVDDLVLLGWDSTRAAGQGSGPKDGGLRVVASPAEGHRTGYWQTPALQAPSHTMLLCQFVCLLPTAPVEVHVAWGPIVIRVWFLLWLGEIVSTTTFDPCRQLTVGSASINFGQVAPFETIKLHRSKTDPSGRGATLSVVCVCSKVPQLFAQCTP